MMDAITPLARLRTLLRARLQRRLRAKLSPSYRTRVCGWFLAMDAAFVLLVVPAYAELSRGYAPADTSYFDARSLAVVTAVNGVWLLGMFVLLAPLQRFVRDERMEADLPTELTRRAAARAHAMPGWAAALWTLKWVTLYVGLGALWHVPAEIGPLFFLGALLTGPPPLAYLLAAFLVAGVTMRVSTLAQAAGARLALPVLSLRWQLSLLGLSLCIAPSLYMSSIAMSEQLPESTRLWMVLLFLAGIVLFAVLCAALFAESIDRPVRVMVDTVRTIAEHGDATAAPRIPSLRRDEIGVLSDHINVMVDRLEATEVERAAASRAVETLNQSLERRVAERTRSLAESNALLAHEMKTRLQLEVELRQAQKLEAVGRLASGIAHEINTPLQFIGDNLAFIDQASDQLLGLVQTYKSTWQRVASSQPPELSEALVRAEQAADLDYLSTDARKALEQASEGLQRVTRIVRSMKSFAHADQTEMAPCDLNEAIRTTLLISAAEYRHCADVETDLRELPLVICHAGAFNQVLLHILINAAHAIVEAGKPDRGRIRVCSRHDRDRAIVSIEDSGKGIPDAIRDRVFEPFFTTREVGKGTGQGLAVCRSVIVDQHGGELDFSSQAGAGTTFFIRLPLEPERRSATPNPLTPALQ